MNKEIPTITLFSNHSLMQVSIEYNGQKMTLDFDPDSLRDRQTFYYNNATELETNFLHSGDETAFDLHEAEEYIKLEDYTFEKIMDGPIDEILLLCVKEWLEEAF